jgi:hypothetical protein
LSSDQPSLYSTAESSSLTQSTIPSFVSALCPPPLKFVARTFSRGLTCQSQFHQCLEIYHHQPSLRPLPVFVTNRSLSSVLAPHKSHSFRSYQLNSPLQMGKNNDKKCKQQKVVPIAQTSDDFDDMLAELRASDPAMITDVASTAARAVVSSSSSSARAEVSLSTGPQPIPAGGANAEIQASNQAIIAACRRGDVIQLRNWGRQGVRITNASCRRFVACD